MHPKKLDDYVQALVRGLAFNDSTSAMPIRRLISFLRSAVKRDRNALRFFGTVESRRTRDFVVFLFIRVMKDHRQKYRILGKEPEVAAPHARRKPLWRFQAAGADEVLPKAERLHAESRAVAEDARVTGTSRRVS